MNANVTATLDARGLNCPLPILKTKKELSKLKIGETLEVTASDPGSIKDMSSFCSQTGNELVLSESNEGLYVFVIKKSN